VGVNIPRGKDDEIGMMIDTFNEMAKRITLSQAELQYKNKIMNQKNDELEEMNEKLEELSVTDGLTGLFNHRHFWNLLNTELTRVDLYQGDLILSGSKSLGVSVGGPEGSGINQSTRLTLAGTLEGVNIDAELSDQSSPIPPEGTTRDIEELDRIVIEVSGERWQGSFGDVEFRVPAEGFGTLRRRAIGGQAAAGFGPAEVSAGYARPKGAFARLTFEGADGIQGTYVLAADRHSAQIVPGSEEVYLDGIPMTRGWDQDYTIDYSTGELVFTNRRIITRLSRIEASFQYVTEFKLFFREVCDHDGGQRLS